MSRQKKQTKYPFLSGGGEWHTNGPVVVGKYTYTRQRQLRAKTVNISHGRPYIRNPLLCKERGDGETLTRKEKHNPKVSKKKERKKERKESKKEKMKEKKSKNERKQRV